MVMESARYKLEVYFAKRYNKLYVDMGGQFQDYADLKFFKTPMQRYFLSGKYKELNDPELEMLWERVKWQKNIARVITVILVLSIFILAEITKSN